MKFVNIVPTQLLDKPEYWCSNWHLILAKKLGTGGCRCSIDEYTQKVLGLKGLGAKIILDNGVFETGFSLSIDKLISFGNEIKADRIVLPDNSNIRELREDISRAQVTMNDLDYHPELVAVLQGNNLLKVYDTFRMMLNTDGIDVIAIPDRLLRERINITRPRLIARLEALFKINKPVHLFALDNWRELEYYKEFKYVNTLDSTFPHKCGMEYIKIPDGLKKVGEPKRPEDYFERKLDKQQLICIKNNVDYIKEILEDE